MPQAGDFDSTLEAAMRHLRKKDKVLAGVIKRVGKLGLPPKAPNSFNTLAGIIIGQQLSGKAARTIFGRVRALNGGNKLSADTVSSMTDDQLRSAGVSRPKIRGLRSLVEHIQNGHLRLRLFPKMSDEEVYDAITQVKGLGPWSAHMYLMFVLRRLDIFPSLDLGIKNAVQRLYGHAQDLDVEAIAENWRPFRTIACWYLWRSLDSGANP